jgi:signal peptidase I
MPGLLTGDYLFVSKLAYGYSRSSFPVGMFGFRGRYLSREPERGDLVVFKTPADNSTDFIKRLVGLPGDRVQLSGGVLHINGEPVRLERSGSIVEDAGPCGAHHTAHLYRETLPGGRSYLIQKLSETCASARRDTMDDTEVFEVPAGRYFMLGDNRDNSADSRYPVPVGVGYVPGENLAGRGALIFFSVDEHWRVRWERIFKVIK